MHYPGFPDNRLIVGGVDLTEEFKMVLVDGYALSPPEPKTYTVDIPGGNGIIDLTESLYGDVVYNNRNQTFKFYVIATDNYEGLKTNISNFLHGKAFDYKMTMDPNYTYHGRFTVTSYMHEMYDLGKVGIFDISISADPYKYRDPRILNLNAIGGIYISANSGRKTVYPTIEVKNVCKVIFNGKTYQLEPGTWTINDIVFKNGENQIYFNTYEMRNMSWGDFNDQGLTWAQIKRKYIFEWYKSEGSIAGQTKVWDDLNQDTWAQHYEADETWGDQIVDPYAISALKPVYLKYEWGDL